MSPSISSKSAVMTHVNNQNATELITSTFNAINYYYTCIAIIFKKHQNYTAIFRNILESSLTHIHPYLAYRFMGKLWTPKLLN